jgi:hypothetical protein
MATDLINHLHLRIRGVPRPGGLEPLEQVEGTFELYRGKWLVLGADDEVRDGAWPGLGASGHSKRDQEKT